MTFTVQNKLAAVAIKGNHHPSFLLLELAEEKLSMQPKFVAAQKMLLKQKPVQTFVNGLLGFITLGIYTHSAYCSIIKMSADRYGQLYLQFAH